jgi:hypothetical protein
LVDDRVALEVADENLRGRSKTRERIVKYVRLRNYCSADRRTPVAKGLHNRQRFFIGNQFLDLESPTHPTWPTWRKETQSIEGQWAPDAARCRQPRTQLKQLVAESALQSNHQWHDTPPTHPLSLPRARPKNRTNKERNHQRKQQQNVSIPH